MMLCPACRGPLVALEYNAIETDYCPACRGVWLDRGELGLLLRGRPDFLPDWKSPAASKGARPCPHCTRAMDMQQLAGGVEVDLCARGHGIWLDKDELRAIIQTQAAPESAEALIGHFSEVFGKGAPL